MKVNRKDVLGVKVDDVTMDQALKTVSGWLKDKGKHYIVTPNPEIIMKAQKDEELKKILNKAGLAIPDGAGLKLTGDIVCNTPGVDLMEGLIKLGAEKGLTTGFLGGRDRVAEKCVERLRSRYPNLKISFTDSGGEVNDNGKQVVSSKYPATDLLFVAFGPPKQEKWIFKNLAKLDIKVMMAVGGAFDFLSGQVPRAPKWLRDLDLEWLFRLIIQPWRIKRQLALLKYLWMVVKVRLYDHN
ncbi:hypothetical protein A3B45_04560 [Candidatus Daviesbacteria bacterium RIFCSPLOWO2_01_FULL_39_12]|uniref:Uncharacterized protein n=1 Tax=Candidatus Daviesbacteria bacterium RIFCSPLOWO2_01_FULL_39_12 TaxID=1797785 RepID=A0A1F5KN41_9BACT|nr:MAG: hypothetical protein A3D79_00180 [Candidatus Daviesbacteria bacterium RIFCSPHIGHO2_02_FULL_39_8]OGE42205.1 MAG: hypothetical protein A3B45_04560 [Candidatus Daviesbacteria bacterium RIFCSPLOWO2_01_FULL_39_12]